MSRVFLATETRFQRQVVLKARPVLARELVEGLSAERFEREIRVSAGLQDARIVPVLSAGITGDRLPWLTMPSYAASRCDSGSSDCVRGRGEVSEAELRSSGLKLLNGMGR